MITEGALIFILLSLAMVAILASFFTLRAVPPAWLPEPGARQAVGVPAGVPVRVICPRTTLPTRVELTRMEPDGTDLDVLTCEEFGDAGPSCHKPCVRVGYPLVQA